MEIKELSTLIDYYLVARDNRLEADREAERLKKAESIILTQLIGILRDESIPAGVGTLGTVRLQKKDKPICTDWQSLYDFIYQNKAFDLLHKRITEGAIKLRLEDGIVVPGVEFIPDYSLSISNVKSKVQ